MSVECRVVGMGLFLKNGGLAAIGTKLIPVPAIEKIFKDNPRGFFVPPVEKIIFAGKRTIIYWEDKTKTTAVCHEGDTFSKEAGLCVAVCKKLFNGYNHIEKLLKTKEVAPANRKKLKEGKKNAD